MITGKDLKQWKVPEGKVYGVILSFINDIELHKKQLKSLVKDIVKSPENYIHDEDWGEVAKLLLPPVNPMKELNKVGCPLEIFGEDLIEEGALDQINVASKLPPSLKAACMPDGHQGYGLPIGGVLATDNVVIPYAVGVDIGCRMHMTITDIPFHEVKGQRDRIKNILIDNTKFGVGEGGAPNKDHPILDDDRFGINYEISNLRDKAIDQIGSSGSGNHFVNIGYVVCSEKGIDVPYLTILSHSGSRGLGAAIASMFTDVATKTCKLPKEATHLAWLPLDSAAGQDYWDAMNLAGDYAKANHEVLHERLVKGLKAKSQEVIQNHHNFAWKEDVELDDGTIREAIVHRKGATPAGKGVVGIIPGSMTAPSYIVSGLGSSKSINSSSHGAGRVMSRKKAHESITKSYMQNDLESADVVLVGGDLDECDAAYKDIDEVMERQTDLVKVIGKFTPWLVRMATKDESNWRKKG